MIAFPLASRVVGLVNLGQVALSVGSQPYRLGRRAGFTDPNIAGKGRSPLEVDDVSRSQ